MGRQQRRLSTTCCLVLVALLCCLLCLGATPASTIDVARGGHHAAAKAAADLLAASKPRRLQMTADGELEEEEDEEELDDEEEEDDEEDEEEEDEDEEDDEEDKPYPELYILDDVASEDGELRATLILDEISEFYEKDEDAPNGGTKYYKIMVHVYNSGFAPICSALLSLSENTVVDQAWTVEEVEDEPNLFEVLWTEQGISPDNPRSISRFVGFVIVGDVVPEIKIEAIEPCGDGDEEDDEEEDDEEEEEDEEENDEGGAMLRFMRAGGAAAREKALMKVWKHDQDYAEDVLFNIDDAARLLSLEVDEARSTLDDHGISASGGGPGEVKGGIEEELHDVLVTAHVTNTADRPLCGVGIWIHNLHKASSYFSLVPVTDKEGRRTDVALLPSLNSTLAAGATQHFSVIIQDMVMGFPNMAVVTASDDCLESTTSQSSIAAAVASAGAAMGAGPETPQ